MSLPLSQTRPKRASAAATADAIGRSLKEQDAAPDCDESAKKKRASEDDDEHVDAQTPAKRQSKPKAAKPSSALKAAPPADVAAIKPAEYATCSSNAQPTLRLLYTWLGSTCLKSQEIL